MLRRFYAPSLQNSSVITLDEREAHHALSVLRFRVGDEVELFDGKGFSAPARITQTSKKGVILERADCRRSKKPLFEIHLAQAVPHKKKLDDIVEKSEELGLGKIILLKSAHTVFDFKRESFNKMLERLRLEILEGAKQSRNDYLMNIEGWKTVHEVADSFKNYTRVFLMAPGASFQADPFDKISLGQVSEEKPLKVLMVIGPEGGFMSEEEKMMLEKGARPITLGNILLRCDTAVVASASLLKFAFERKLNELPG